MGTLEGIQSSQHCLKTSHLQFSTLTRHLQIGSTGWPCTAHAVCKTQLPISRFTWGNWTTLQSTKGLLGAFSVVLSHCIIKICQRQANFPELKSVTHWWKCHFTQRNLIPASSNHGYKVHACDKILVKLLHWCAPYCCHLCDVFLTTFWWILFTWPIKMWELSEVEMTVTVLAFQLMTAPPFTLLASWSSVFSYWALENSHRVNIIGDLTNNSKNETENWTAWFMKCHKDVKKLSKTN